jgi:uncharacterized protein (DUF2336 family)
MDTFDCKGFIAEVEGALRSSSPDRHVRILRQVTGLLLSCSNRLNEQQIGIFDDVLVRLIQTVDARPLATLSMAVAGLTSAPREALRRLAFHEDAAVASPILLRSDSLSERELIEIAACGSQQHLLAICGRSVLGEALTDAVLTRADTNVCRILAKKADARFSEAGYCVLVAAAGRDDEIADSLVLRPDMPVGMIDELLATVTKPVRGRLLRIAPAGLRETIRTGIEKFAIRDSLRLPQPIDYSEARSLVQSLSKGGKLNDSAINRFAVRNEKSNLIAALSLLADVAIGSIERLIEESDRYGLMVACRASRLNWQTTVSVVSNGKGARHVPSQELDELKEAFEAFCLSTAQSTIRFGSARDFATKRGPVHTAHATAGTSS